MTGLRRTTLVITLLALAGFTHAGSLKDARAAFQTKAAETDYEPSGEISPPLYKAYQLVQYPSPAGKLAAYLSADPKDGKRHPAVVWAHGGFGSIDSPDLAPQPAHMDQSPDLYRAAGFVV